MRAYLMTVILTFCLVGNALAELVPLTLVRAIVVSVDSSSNGKVETVQLEIVHVYAGVGEMKGKTFTDIYRNQDLHGRAARTPFKKGEEGLWILSGGTNKALVPSTDHSLPFRYRSRQTDSPDYVEHVKLAEAIESVYGADERKQGKILVAMAGGKSPEIATWAVWKLGESEDFAADKFLNVFVAKPDVNMPLRAQVVMDQVLAKVRREDWCESKTRAGLLKAWASGKVEEDDGYRILNHIIHAFDRKDVENELACEVVRLAINNKDWPLLARKYAARQLAQLGRRPDDWAAVDRLIDVVRGVADKDLREAAAAAIRKSIELDDKREAALSEAEVRKDK